MAQKQPSVPNCEAEIQHLMLYLEVFHFRRGVYVLQANQIPEFSAKKSPPDSISALNQNDYSDRESAASAPWLSGLIAFTPSD